MKNKIYTMLTAFLLLVVFAMAQTPQGKVPKPFFGKAGITKKISELEIRATKKPLDSTAIKPLRSYFKKYQDLLARPVRPNTVGIPLAREGGEEEDRTMPATAVTSAATANSYGSTQQIWSNFLSLDFYENPIGWPPDPSGAVGATQVIVSTNNGIKVFEKPAVTDPPLVTPTGYSRTMAPSVLFVPLDQFFSPVLPFGSSVSDPHIRYDRLSKRWFVVCIEVNPTFENNLIFLAVSDGDRVTKSSSFTYYSFNSSLFPYDPTAPYAPFLDYPTLGVDGNSVVIGGNQFGWDSLTNVGYVIDKKKLINGNLVVYPIELGVVNFLTGTINGMYTPQGVHNDDPYCKKSFFAGITYFLDGIVVASLEYNKKNQPFLAQETTVPVGQFYYARDNSSPGGLTPIDQLDTRLFAAAIYKNKITGKSSLWTAHAIGVNQSGNYISGTDSDYTREARSGSRWYEIGNIYSTPTLSQLGTLHDASQPSGRRAVQYFNPSIAANGQGHAVLSGTTDAFDEYLNVFAAGRYNGDAQGTLQTPVKATNTTAIYAPYISFGVGFHAYIGRWGDFSQTVVDPLDDQTIYAFQEYANVDDSYGVRVVQLKAPAPATPLPLGPLYNNADTVVTLEGVSVDNSGFFDPGKDQGGPGYNRLSVKSTGNIIASDIKFLSPAKLSFKLNTKNQPAGKYTLTVTNPDGQFVSTEYTINAQMPANSISSSGSANAISNKIAQKYIITSNINPNPTNREVKLQVNAAKEFRGKILLLDISGKVIFQNSYNFNKGSSEALLSLANLSNGSYIAVVYSSDNFLIAMHKIVKQ